MSIAVHYRSKTFNRPRVAVGSSIEEAVRKIVNNGDRDESVGLQVKSAREVDLLWKGVARKQGRPEITYESEDYSETVDNILENVRVAEAIWTA